VQVFTAVTIRVVIGAAESASFGTLNETIRTNHYEARAFVAAGTYQQPQRFVVAEADTVDEAQASGAWLATDTPAEVRR
jgi:hypothetical protein